MFQHTLYRDVSLKTALHWYLLAFLSGNVNAGGFLAFDRFITHVTGFATLFGIDVATGRWDAAIGILSVPAYFLLGSMVSAYLIDRPAQLDRRPRYALVMALVAGCLALAAFLGHFNFFGTFGDGLRLKRDYFLLALLCAASGLQNAAISTASGATVRTTHLTGITTDLGIGLVRAFTLSRIRKPYQDEIKTAWLRLGTIIAFIVGSVTGAVLFLKIHYLGFLLPTALATYASMIALKSLPPQQEQ